MRLNGCFYDAYAECAAAPACIDLEDCLLPAMVASDPSSFDAAAVEACEAGDEAACDEATQGPLRDCFDLAHTCDAWDDLCLDVVMLAEPYRSDSRACLSGPCSDLEACLNAASGRPSE